MANVRIEKNDRVMLNAVESDLTHAMAARINPNNRIGLDYWVAGKPLSYGKAPYIVDNDNFHHNTTIGIEVDPYTAIKWAQKIIEISTEAILKEQDEHREDQ